MSSRIVILAKNSIFLEGVATRFGQLASRVEVVFVDPEQSDYIEKITTIQPIAVLMDASSTRATQCCLLCELLLANPNITLMRLVVDQTDVQVVTSQKHCFSEVQDLINILAPL